MHFAGISFRKLHSLEADIEKWKMDYVTLIQSSIRFPGEEGTDDLELSLYGGDKVKLYHQGSHRLEKYLNLEGFLEKSLKVDSVLKSTGKITQKL